MTNHIPIEVSARHIHLSKIDSEILFGKKYIFSINENLSQSNQYSTIETVKLVSKKDCIDNVRLIMPIRSETQVEVSLTDARKLGIMPPVRESGHLLGSVGGVKIIGPKGKIELKYGVIVSKRHLHIEPDKAKDLELSNGQIISIKVKGERSTTYHDVVVRSKSGIDNLSFMIDTDEANASGISSDSYGEIVYE